MGELYQFIEDNIAIKSTLVLACSGGPDSMFLFHVLMKCAKKRDLQLIVAHVNHKIREESDEEEVFLKEYVEKLGVEFVSISLTKSAKMNEEIARKKRYAFLMDCVKKKNAKYLLTAHHGDDLIETVLMRITRGSNLSGYAGIKKVQQKDNVTILRPLLDYSKEQILDYNKKENIPFVVDKSNMSNQYTRNRYRNVVLPFLKKEDQNIHKKYMQFSEEANSYCTFVKTYILEHQFLVDNQIVINRMENESTFIKRKTVELLIHNIQQVDLLDINNDQLKEIMKLFEGRNRKIDLNNGYVCIKDYNILAIRKDHVVSDYEFVFNDFVKHDDWSIFKLDSTNDFSNNSICLLSDEIKLPFIVRNRRMGDVIEVKNLNGTKKIKDIFIDEKILMQKRSELPIVTDSENHILWIPGVKKSKFAKDKTQKYDIILKYEVRKKDE